MKRNEITTIDELKKGDRFRFLYKNDDETYQVLKKINFPSQYGLLTAKVRSKSGKIRFIKTQSEVQYFYNIKKQKNAEN